MTGYILLADPHGMSHTMQGWARFLPWNWISKNAVLLSQWRLWFTMTLCNVFPGLFQYYRHLSKIHNLTFFLFGSIHSNIWSLCSGVQIWTVFGGFLGMGTSDLFLDWFAVFVVQMRSFWIPTSGTFEQLEISLLLTYFKFSNGEAPS